MKKLFLLALPFILFSCSSNDDNTYYPPPAGPTGDAYSYLRGEIDGASFNYTYNVNDITGTTAYGPTTSISGVSPDQWFSYGGMFSPITNFDKFIYVSFANIFQGSYTDETAQFYTAFASVPSNYLTFAQDGDHNRGVDIGYQISNNLNYTTLAGPQTGSTFIVISSSEGIEGGHKTKTVTGTFSCKLYNQDDVTDVLNVTNGSFKVVTSEDF